MNNDDNLAMESGSSKTVANLIQGRLAVDKMVYPDKGIKCRVDGFWLGILVIIASPVSTPIKIAIILSSILIFCSLLVVLFTLVVIAFAIILGVFLSFFASIGVWFVARMTGVLFAGLGIFLTGLGTLTVLIIINLWGLVFRLISRMFNYSFEKN